MRIDAHVHYWPPSMASKLDHFIDQEPYWGGLLRPKGRRSVQGWSTADQMIERMNEAALDKVVLVGEYYQRHESSIARNRQAVDIITRWPNRIIALATVQPKAGKAALDELKWAVDHGLAGVGELNPYAQGYALDDVDFLRIVETCIDYDLPLMLHTNETVGPYYPGKSPTPLRDYYRLAERFPELRLILAHWGGGLIFYEMMPKVGQVLSNVWYDTAASPLLYPTAKIFKVALAAVDHQKILYGSDYPLLLYPRRQTKPDFGRFVDEIKALDLSKKVFDAVMGHNAAHVFGLLNERIQPGRQAEAGNRVRDATLDNNNVRGMMAVSLVAKAWPATQSIFERFRIPWQDSSVPAWEPIVQAAAARGWGPKDQQRLLDELNQAVSEL